jgi:hypothetical protein
MLSLRAALSFHKNKTDLYLIAITIYFIFLKKFLLKSLKFTLAFTLADHFCGQSRTAHHRDSHAKNNHLGQQKRET